MTRYRILAGSILLVALGAGCGSTAGVPGPPAPPAPMLPTTPASGPASDVVPDEDGGANEAPPSR
jgi:hypothetical protein